MTAVQDLLKQAMQYHKKGDSARAEGLYREVLREEPENSDALHLMGVLVHQLGRAADAVALIEKAVAQNGKTPFYYFNLGLAQKDVGKIENAARSFAKVLELDPSSIPALLNLGVIRQEQRRHDDAMDLYRRALDIDPKNADIYLNIGTIMRNRNLIDEAIRYYRKAIELRPDFTLAHNTLGRLLSNLNRSEEADASYQRCLENDPDDVPALNNLGRSLQDQRRFDEALACYQKALALKPDYYEILVNLGSCLNELKRFDESIRIYHAALKVNPQGHEALTNLGHCYQTQGKLDEALKCFEQAIDIAPQDPEARVSRAMIWLQQARYDRAWKEYEWRWKSKDRPRDRHFAKPMWDGSSLAGKTLLVHAEQGVGDEIMFASCLPELIAKSRHCYLTCDERLEMLFARSFPAATVIGVPRGKEDFPLLSKYDFDYHIPAGNVPRYLRGSVESFPRYQHYLVADSTRIQTWQKRLDKIGPGLKVGIAWRGGSKPKDRELRSTTLDQWRSVLEIPGVHFVNVQYGDCKDELKAASEKMGKTIHHWADVNAMTDLDGFAAQLASLDLIIAIGNASVHLGGALGVPTWGLLPASWGWRWKIGQEETPWYYSVRILRQSQHGDWHELFERVRNRLLACVDSPIKINSPGNYLAA